MPPAAPETRPPARFVVLEGLSAVGKSTVAPLLAKELDAALIAVPSLFNGLRVHIDGANLVMARLHFWMTCNYVVSDRARQALAEGRRVVVESYFYRTLATHAAMGVSHLPSVDWRRAARPDLPVLLTIDEQDRQRRLSGRYLACGRTHWAQLEESDVETTRQAYASFGLMPFDTTGLSVHQVVTRLAHLARR